MAIARGLLLAAHGHVLSAHTMVGDGHGGTVTEDELDAELTHQLTRSLTP